MLNLRDCLDLADLNEEEIAAIARHEHIPLIVALELGQHLLNSPGGGDKVRQFIVEDIGDAQLHHNCQDCEAFSRTLARYLKDHPRAENAERVITPRILELLAIGQAEETNAPPSEQASAAPASPDDVHDAKTRHDCCACVHLSREIMRSLDRDQTDEGGEIA